MIEERKQSTLIRIWDAGSLGNALRGAAEIIDGEGVAATAVEQVYTEYDDQGWSVNIVIGAVLPDDTRRAASRHRRVRARQVISYTDRPDGGSPAESQQEYLGL